MEGDALPVPTRRSVSRKRSGPRRNEHLATSELQKVPTLLARWTELTQTTLTTQSWITCELPPPPCYCLPAQAIHRSPTSHSSPCGRDSWTIIRRGGLSELASWPSNPTHATFDGSLENIFHHTQRKRLAACKCWLDFVSTRAWFVSCAAQCQKNVWYAQPVASSGDLHCKFGVFFLVVVHTAFADAYALPTSRCGCGQQHFPSVPPSMQTRDVVKRRRSPGCMKKDRGQYGGGLVLNSRWPAELAKVPCIHETDELLDTCRRQKEEAYHRTAMLHRRV